jgi:hypothetical protein
MPNARSLDRSRSSTISAATPIASPFRFDPAEVGMRRPNFYVRFCFPNAAAADAFRDRFGGKA